MMRANFFLASLALFFSAQFSTQILLAQNPLEPPVSLGSGGAHAVEIYDFDGDGDNDVVRFGTLGQVRWHENESGLQSDALPTNPPIAASSGYAIDFDKDGDRDLVVMQSQGTFWHENLDGKGSFGSGYPIYPKWITGGEFFVEDMDGDGDFDVLPQQWGVGKLIWYKNVGNKLPFEEQQVVFESADPNPAIAAAQINYSEVGLIYAQPNGLPDIILNASGDVDLISAGTKIRFQVLNIYNLGNGNFGKYLNPIHVFYYSQWGSDINFLKSIDLNSDGKKEMSAISITGGLMLVESMMCAISHTFKEIDASYVGYSPANGGQFFKDFLTLDTDGDGKDELLGMKDNWLTFYPEYPNISPKLDDVFKSSQYGFSSPMAKGDVDGDGKDEFFCTVNGQLSIFGDFLQAVYKFNATGAVFFDKNENGQKDAGEPNLSNQLVQISPTFYTALAQDSSGFSFKTYASTGAELKCLADKNWDFTTPASVEFKFGKDTAVHFDFGLKPKTLFSKGKIDLTSATPRCEKLVPFWLTVENSGTQYFDGWVSMTYLDDLATFAQAAPAPDSVAGSTFFWKIKQLAPTHLQKITITNLIAGADQQGKTFVFQPKLEILDAAGAVAQTETDHYKNNIRCSFDPNDKLIAPDQPGNDGNFIFKNSDLNFTVRFQNTGNDTAFQVKIEDQLDTNLDWQSLRVIGASHEPFFANVDNRGLLTVEFPNILLPDSTTNLAGSQGFVKFSIRPKSTAVGSKITNQAKIFFDSNPAVPTNLVQTLISESLFNIKIVKPCSVLKEGSIAVFPNFMDNGDLTYDWGFSDQQEIVVPEAGEFPLKIRQGGVVILDTIFEVENAPIFASTSSSTATPGLADGWVKISASGAGMTFTYLWDTPNADTTKMVKNLAAGTYHCTVTNQSGCSQVFQIVLPAKVVDLNEPDWASLVRFDIAPNPNLGNFQVKIETPAAANWQLEISNSLGILEKTFAAPDFLNLSNFLEINDLGAGLHFVSLKIGDTRLVKKVVVLH